MRLVRLFLCDRSHPLQVFARKEPALAYSFLKKDFRNPRPFLQGRVRRDGELAA